MNLPLPRAAKAVGPTFKQLRPRLVAASQKSPAGRPTVIFALTGASKDSSPVDSASGVTVVVWSVRTMQRRLTRLRLLYHGLALIEEESNP